MAFATRTIRDTNIATGEGTQAGYVTVVLNFDADTASDNLAVDGSALSGFANGAKIHLTRAWWALLQGTAASNTGDVELEFKGASADTTCIRLAGTGHYDGTAGSIKGNATNTTATSSDIEAVTRGATGYAILEFRKDEAYTA